MRRPTYEEQWQKITTAYLNNQLEPWESCACFVGNLLNGEYIWHVARSAYLMGDMETVNESTCIRNVLKEQADSFYTPREIYDLEELFLRTISDEIVKNNTKGAYRSPSIYSQVYRDPYTVGIKWKRKKESPEYEDALYKAMVVTLEALRELHESKGENCNAIPLAKRELQAG